MAAQEPTIELNLFGLPALLPKKFMTEAALSQIDNINTIAVLDIDDFVWPASRIFVYVILAARTPKHRS